MQVTLIRLSRTQTKVRESKRVSAAAATQPSLAEAGSGMNRTVFANLNTKTNSTTRTAVKHKTRNTNIPLLLPVKAYTLIYVIASHIQVTKIVEKQQTVKGVIQRLPARVRSA